MSALYTGWVMHRRHAPRVHHFRYGVFAMLLDLDELSSLARRLRLFKWNRPGIFSFQDRDHGDGRPLREWLDDLLAQAGIIAPGPRRVLCYPRIFGYVFNPLSVWFCHDADGAIKAVVHEVHNTYRERHFYVLETGGDFLQHSCDKQFYVSPFLSYDCSYNFHIEPPRQSVVVSIQQQEHGRPVLAAAFHGVRRSLDDRALLAMLLRYPLMTLKVIAAIHFEAMRLIFKGLKRHPHSGTPA